MSRRCPSSAANSFGRASAAGTSATKSAGKGTNENTNDFSGSITAVVTAVLPNGHLMISGEKQIGVNHNVDVLRFSGQVDPRAIVQGNSGGLGLGRQRAHRAARPWRRVGCTRNWLVVAVLFESFTDLTCLRIGREHSPLSTVMQTASDKLIRALIALALRCWPAPRSGGPIQPRRPASRKSPPSQGVRSNPLTGYGLVVGLDGTGDQTTQAPFTGQSLAAMLQQFGVILPQGVTMQPRNIAAVMVTTQLPPFAQPGQQLDINVSSIGNAKSLRGGTLIATPLRGADGQIYAIAQGNLIVGGAGASAGGSKVQINHLSAGRIPAGALVERSVPTALQTSDFIQLDLNAADYNTARAVAKAINRAKGEGVAQALDGRVVRVRAPTDADDRVGLPGRSGEPQPRSGRTGRPHRHQRPHRLGGDEPGRHPVGLRGGARQSVGDDQFHARRSASPTPCPAARPR